MLSAFGRVIKTADLRRKLLFTLGMIVLYRMGTFIPAPGISYGTVQQCLNANQTHGGAYDIINLFSGGALLQLSIFALGVMPYITGWSAMVRSRLTATSASQVQVILPCHTRRITLG